MLFAVAGDAHGALERLYTDVLAFEVALGERFDFVLHVGDFGVWPEASRVDRATRAHDGAGDFPKWFADQRAVPRRTVMIKGNHEDFAWLESKRGSELLPGLTYLPNGKAVRLEGPAGIAVHVGGVGGCFGPSGFQRLSQSLQGYARRHYTADELSQLCEHGPLDVVLFHDAPAGVEFVKRYPSGDERRYTSEAQGLVEALTSVRPQLCFFGHHHARVDARVGDVPCFGLNAVGHRGSVVAVRMHGDRSLAVTAEWPK